MLPKPWDTGEIERGSESAVIKHVQPRMAQLYTSIVVATGGSRWPT